MFDFDGKVLYKAISETFKRRKTPLSENPTVFTAEFEQMDNKHIQWNAFKKRMKSDFDVSFEEVIRLIRVFLETLYMNIIKELNFEYKWICDGKKWCLAKSLNSAVREAAELYTAKISKEALKKEIETASRDPLFLKDTKESMDDFKTSDKETAELITDW